MSLGIPAITIGSGGGGGRAHSVDEYVNVERNAFINGLSSGLALVVAVANLDWTKK
jgi:tripeptide aminopeptidase